MSQDELRVLNDKLDKFMEETRKNFGSVNDSLNTFEKKQEDCFLKLGKVENEVYLLNGNVKNQNKTVGRKMEELGEHIEGSTKIVIKEVDKAKKRWFEVWKKGK